MVHRDFKPDNVLVGGDGRVRVTDFGLAQLVAIEVTLPAWAAAAELVSAPALGPSGSGAIVGTPAYMAPEQRRGISDERSDLFSFCVAFWEALHGERPFAGRDLRELADAVAAGAIRPPARGPRRPGAPARRHPARPPAGAGQTPGLDGAAPRGDRGRRGGRAAGAAGGADGDVRARPRARARRGRPAPRPRGERLAPARHRRGGHRQVAARARGRRARGGERHARDLGRAWEAGGAMPYWPWVQIFRELGTDPFRRSRRAETSPRS